MDPHEVALTVISVSGFLESGASEALFVALDDFGVLVGQYVIEMVEALLWTPSDTLEAVHKPLGFTSAILSKPLE